MKDDRRAADERLRKEQEKVDKALQAARNAGGKDREVKELAAQVDSLTVCNKQLLDEVEHDKSWYHSKTEFNNCFIIHFSRNSSSETEAKRSAILFLRRTLQGA